MKKKIIIVAVIVALGGLIGWRLMANKKEINSRKEVKTTVENIAVTVAEVTEKSAERNLALVGTTEANQEITIACEAAGKIIEINFKLGDYVTKGKTLARVDDSYKKLALETAKVNFNKYKEDVQRYQNLRDGDAVSETQLRDIKVAYENAKIQLEQAQQQLEDTYIRAPFNGYITSKEIDLGKYVNVANPIAGIADISELKIIVPVSESNVYNIKQGQQALVSTQVYPDAKLIGKVANISPKGDKAHSYPIEITLSNTKQYPLKSGTYVNVTVDMGQTHSMLTIPRDAIVSSIKDPSVYLVKDGQVKLTKITIGQDYGKELEILQGLQQGDQVVTSGQINLIDGARVSVIKN